MLRASALYIVIIIALVIGLLCSAVIAAGYYYREQYQSNSRYAQLRNNQHSAVNLLLTQTDNDVKERKISLFGGDHDSVTVLRLPWGVFEAGSVKTFIQHDTLSQSFLMARELDSTKWSALYIIDEDRSVSVSGATHIRGTAYVPKAGIREAYVNNQAYSGDKRIVIGPQKNSEKTLPLLSVPELTNLKKQATDINTSDSTLLKKDSSVVSFLKPLRSFTFGKKPETLSHIFLKGHIMLHSDTTLTLDSTAVLEDVLVFAKNIIIKSGFTGRCQLFATDSLSVGPRCQFNYPSCLAVVSFDEKNKAIKTLNLGDQGMLEGVAFISDAYKGKLPPVLSLGKNTMIKGQLYVQGLLNLKDKVAIYGSVSANRFLYQTSYTRYENYLINLDIDGSKLSRYYLSGAILPATAKKRKVLQWLY